jgi:transcription elongation factor GreA
MMSIATLASSADAPAAAIDGKERVKEDLELLTTVWRRGIAARLRDARRRGEIAGRPDLFDVLEEQLERVLTVQGPADRPAALGTHVRFDDLEHQATLEYELVRAIEGDPAGGKLSIASPLGRALLGRRAGDVVEVDDAARGPIQFQVRAVLYGAEDDEQRLAPR